ncbi:peptidoglycan-associated (lipo)protein [Oleiphilus messinensis]|uniref:Peptidoglycan-associated (Lipo)protein n=2 Tax=Oleiphilus messinensis TaxID=141451 RepID=A0A1Y0IAH3_9GAMM|nr:peptidoglycan-associated (lipo)protein [Oleiphilus messinensis]
MVLGRMIVLVTRFFLALVLLVFAKLSFAVTFVAGIEASQWYISTSIFECSLTHSIPDYGKGVFYHEAGEPLKFYLEAYKNPMRSGEAALVIEAPDWLPGTRVTDLGYVPVGQSTRPVTVMPHNSTMMMASLMEGRMPTFTRKAVYADESVRVRINPVNFKAFYNDYLACVATLLPVNFRQVERTVVLFEVDKAVLTKEDLKSIDNVVLYVKADPSVSSIFVDGHTDSSGRRIYNRRLSKERAEVVTQYLVDHGIKEELITTRYHGERYPAVSNKTFDSRKRNRRSTIRLERGPRAPKSTPIREAQAGTL